MAHQTATDHALIKYTFEILIRWSQQCIQETELLRRLRKQHIRDDLKSSEGSCALPLCGI